MILFLAKSVKQQQQRYSQNSSSQESPGNCLAASRLQKENLKAIGNRTAPYKKQHDRVSPEGLKKIWSAVAKERLTALCIFWHDVERQNCIPNGKSLLTLKSV